MSSAFVLLNSQYNINGFPVARFDAPPNDLPGHKDIAIARLRVQPGSHEVGVVLHYRGNGEGVFSYMKGYKFAVRSSHKFTMTPSTHQVALVAFEKGGPTTPLEERPAVRIEVDVPRTPPADEPLEQAH